MKGPIGIFDSGYGGLTIYKEVQSLLPHYDYIYLGDNARAPYGSRSFDIVYEFTLEAVRFLFEQGCPLVILACNTASAKALRSIQQNVLPTEYPDRKVLGVIRPTTEMAGELCPDGALGICATEGTVNSNSYGIEIAKFYPQLEVVQKACPLWVPLIESGKAHSTGGKAIIRQDLDELFTAHPQISSLLLACTHYPLILDVLQELVPAHVNVIAQGPIVAEKLQRYLERHPMVEERLLRNESERFLTTENTTEFDAHAGQFLLREINSEHAVLY